MTATNWQGTPDHPHQSGFHIIADASEDAEQPLRLMFWSSKAKLWENDITPEQMVGFLYLGPVQIEFPHRKAAKEVWDDLGKVASAKMAAFVPPEPETKSIEPDTGPLTPTPEETACFDDLCHVFDNYETDRVRKWWSEKPWWKKALCWVPPYHCGGSTDAVLWYSVYGYSGPKWFKPVVKALHRFQRFFDDGIYYPIRNRTVSRYHIVKLHTPPGYRDIDDRMFHAAFALLGEFVEKELGTEPWSEETELHNGYRVHFEGPVQPQAIDLWLWYKDHVAGKLDPNLNHSKNYDDMTGEEELALFAAMREYDELVEEKFDELMYIRRHLWT